MTPPTVVSLPAHVTVSGNASVCLRSGSALPWHSRLKPSPASLPAPALFNPNPQLAKLKSHLTLDFTTSSLES